MMEELYILGNGFDLYLGLKTQYLDYFEARKINEEFFKKLDLIHQQSSSYFIRDNKGIERLSFNKTQLRYDVLELYKKTGQNLFYLYLEFLKKENLMWKDVESKIILFINNIAKVLGYPLEALLREAKENEMYKYYMILKIVLEEVKEKRNIKILDFTLEQLNLFEKDFGNYIGSLELKEKNESKILNIFRTNCRRKIINFNYSLILQKLKSKYENISYSEIEIIKRIKSIESIVNIHGDFKNPIFGIDSHNSEEQFQNFTKTSRILNNDTVGNFELPKPEKLGTINFFGHSLSEADYSYFQSLFDYYDIYSSNIKLNFMYSEYDKNDLTRAKRETHNNVVKLMNNYGEKLENKDKGKNLLHKLLIENRIKLLNIDKRNGIIDNANYSFI